LQTGRCSPLLVYRRLARRARPKERADRGRARVFAFLATELNATVTPIHPKAMLVILTPEEGNLWLTADAPKALELSDRAPP
jgi:putative SOS response-associated peptidase YedK